MTVKVVTHDHHTEQNTKRVVFCASHKRPLLKKNTNPAPRTKGPAMAIVIPFFAPKARYRFIVDDRGCIVRVVYLDGIRKLRAGEAD
jgi:hypothetical protein